MTAHAAQLPKIAGMQMSEGDESINPVNATHVFRVNAGPLEGLRGRIVALQDADRVVLKAEGIVNGVLFVLERRVLSAE